jgi:hypothetical protein
MLEDLVIVLLVRASIADTSSDAGQRDRIIILQHTKVAQANKVTIKSAREYQESVTRL